MGQEGRYITIDLQNESIVTDKNIYSDGMMNIDLEDAKRESDTFYFNVYKLEIFVTVRYQKMLKLVKRLSRLV